MKQNISLVLAFAAGAVLVGVGLPMISKGAGGVDEESVKQIVRDVIANEPQLIVDSVRNMQNKDRAGKVAEASQALKDDDLKNAMYYNERSPFTGPKDSKKVVVEFFDYNCPACKMQYTALAELMKAHKDVKIVFKEYPIFGEQSDKNAMIALAVNRADPKKYIAFHEKMMTFQGRANEEQALGFVKEIGLDVEKIKADAASKEVADIIAMNRELGAKINAQGTPTVIVADEVVPHAVSMQDIKTKLKL